jgi:hypothetical protein
MNDNQDNQRPELNIIKNITETIDNLKKSKDIIAKEYPIKPFEFPEELGFFTESKNEINKNLDYIIANLEDHEKALGEELDVRKAYDELLTLLEQYVDYMS